MLCKIISFSFLLVSGFALCSCGNHQLHPDDYVRYITDSSNGLRKTLAHSDVYFTAQYEPLDYVCLQENPDIRSSNELMDLRKEFEGLLHFNFSITSRDHQTDPLQEAVNEFDYQEKIAYLAFEAHKDFFLVCGKDTLPCVVHHFERNYGLMPRVDLVLGFHKKAFNPDNSIPQIILFFNDSFFGSGLNAFIFRKSDLTHIPQLKLTSL